MRWMRQPAPGADSAPSRPRACGGMARRCADRAGRVALPGTCWPRWITSTGWSEDNSGPEAKTNEIPMFATRLDYIDLARAVVTGDALIPPATRHSACGLPFIRLNGYQRPARGFLPKGADISGYVCYLNDVADGITAGPGAILGFGTPQKCWNASMFLHERTEHVQRWPLLIQESGLA
jgi:hypothetical protein